MTTPPKAPARHPYGRTDWLDGWYTHGSVSQVQLARAKAPVNFNGKVLCPYTWRWTLPSDMQLDHVIPLGFLASIVRPDITLAERRYMGHAEFNLLLVSGEANESKGERGIADWLPSHPDFHRPYAVIWQYAIYAFRLQHMVPERHMKVIEKLLGGKA